MSIADTERRNHWPELTAERIKLDRERIRLSQEQFATLLGLEEGRGLPPSLFTVSRWELGKQAVGKNWGHSLKRLLERIEAGRYDGVDPRDIVGG